MLAMQALAEFAGLTFSPNSNLDVEVKAGYSSYNFNINDKNKIVLQRMEVCSNLNEIKNKNIEIRIQLDANNWTYQIEFVRIFIQLCL